MDDEFEKEGGKQSMSMNIDTKQVQVELDSPTNSQQTDPLLWKRQRKPKSKIRRLWQIPNGLSPYNPILQDWVFTIKEKRSSNINVNVSDDDEIDYSIKPEFYDPDLDEKDESWIRKKKKGRRSDAVLSCPACFTTLCLECQRHERYVTQYRATLVVNCKIKAEEVLSQKGPNPKNKSSKASSERAGVSLVTETCKSVCCLVCSTVVGAFDEDEVYHFFNVIPSEC